VQFVIKVDARTLVHQLNKSAAGVPGVPVNRWLAWIRLFDFDVRSVTGKKHLVAEGLSRRSWTPEDDDESESEVEDFLDAQVFCLGVHSYRVHAGRPRKKASAGRPLMASLIQSQDTRWSKAATPDILIVDSSPGSKGTPCNIFYGRVSCFCRGSKNVPLRRVVARPEVQKEIVTYRHDRLGQKGLESTYK